jgi:hypothetical protein
MKLTYLPLSLFLWLAACSSPAAQNKPQNITQQQDTSAAQSDSQPVDPKQNTTTVTAGDSTPAHVYKARIFLEEDGVTVPPYGLEKVKALVAKIQFIEDDGIGGSEGLDEKKYNSLSLKEKFTYHMVHPESYSQNCDGLPAHPNEAKRIYGTLTDVYGEYEWNERQLNFFKNNRTDVAELMKLLIEKEHRIGNNFKEAIVDMNATELIPYLINFYNKEKKDHYILTMLLLLMKNNNYPEFVNSTGYIKLYGDRATEDYNNAPYLVYNKANEDLIIQRATKFYNGLQAK